MNESSNDGNTVLLKVLNTNYGFEQLINEPTRTTQTSSNLIDLALTNHPERITISGVIQLGLSEHDLIYCVRKINRYNTKHGHKEINYTVTSNLLISKLSKRASAKPLGINSIPVMMQIQPGIFFLFLFLFFVCLFVFASV